MDPPGPVSFPGILPHPQAASAPTFVIAHTLEPGPQNALSVLVVSDIHYAGPGEQARRNHEARVIANPCLRIAVKLYRRYVWLRDPFGHNHLLDDLLARPEEPDLVIANGDYSVDTEFIGVSDPEARASAATCLSKLRTRFGHRLHLVMGDHELGKMSMFGGRGGLRLASLALATEELGLPTCWNLDCGRYRLIGVTSTLLALPVYEPETLPEERAAWYAARENHLEEVRAAFDSVKPDQRIILFCHDPTALPALLGQAAVRAKLPQIERTIIGHLHSRLVYWQSRVLSGLPPIRFLGNTIRRLTQALHEARRWRSFRVTLCPALAGIELLKDGACLWADLPRQGNGLIRWRLVPVPRRPAG